MEEQPAQLVLPTGQEHFSHSELSTWHACAYRHKLRYIDKIDVYQPSPYADFGTIMHGFCERFLKEKSTDKQLVVDAITQKWAEMSYGEPAPWHASAVRIMDDFPSFIDSQFPGWAFVAAEEKLVESVQGKGVKFKGYIDGILSVEKKGKPLVWILDYKTCSWGWTVDKRRSEIVNAQLVLYKTFYAQKLGVPVTDIRCAFVLLKRDGKPGNSCELVAVSVGPKTQLRALKMVDNMLTAMESGLFIKNRNSCRYCPYAETEWCP